MSKTQLKSFVDQYVAALKGDKDTVSGEKTYRQRVSALKSHISSYEGDTIDFEDKVQLAKENLNNARVNNSCLILNRKDYILNLFKAREELEDSEEMLENHLAKIAFLNGELIG